MNPPQQYCDGHGIGLVSWNWDCLAVVSGMFQKVPQKSLAPRTSWCGSRCEVGRGQDLVVRMSIYCRHTLGVPRRLSISHHLYTLRILIPLLVVFISLILQHSVYVQSSKMHLRRDYSISFSVLGGFARPRNEPVSKVLSMISKLGLGKRPQRTR